MKEQKDQAVKKGQFRGRVRSIRGQIVEIEFEQNQNAPVFF